MSSPNTATICCPNFSSSSEGRHAKRQRWTPFMRHPSHDVAHPPHGIESPPHSVEPRPHGVESSPHDIAHCPWGVEPRPRGVEWPSLDSEHPPQSREPRPRDIEPTFSADSACVFTPPHRNPAPRRRRLTRFLFSLFAITWLVSGATVVLNAWIAQDLKRGHASRASRCWNAGVASKASACFLAAMEKYAGFTACPQTYAQTFCLPLRHVPPNDWGASEET